VGPHVARVCGAAGCEGPFPFPSAFASCRGVCARSMGEWGIIALGRKGFLAPAPLRNGLGGAALGLPSRCGARGEGAELPILPGFAIVRTAVALLAILAGFSIVRRREWGGHCRFCRNRECVAWGHALRCRGKRGRRPLRVEKAASFSDSPLMHTSISRSSRSALALDGRRAIPARLLRLSPKPARLQEPGLRR
jgi:hypothetical protein